MTPSKQPATVTEASEQRDRQTLSAEVDLCVMCGLCLPHCPTYRLSRNEAESPRGRIAIIKHLEDESASLAGADLTHLDRCLLCQACEQMCPSGVPFERIMDQARAELRNKGAYKPPFLARVMSSQLSSESGRARLSLATGWYSKSPALRALAKRLSNNPSWQTLTSSIPDATSAAQPRQRAPYKPASTSTHPGVKKTVQLFLGCADQIWDEQAIQASTTLLEALGHTVLTPEGQDCCGALASHDGDSATAERLSKQNQNAFHPDSTVIGLSTACTSHLKDSTQLNAEHILSFLLADARWGALEFAPHSARIAVHTPCSQRNGLRQADLTERALARIPGLEISSLSAPTGCCGAAGNYLLRYPDTAQALRAPLLDQATALAPDLLVTTNLGCQLHLQSGLKQLTNDLKVAHPVSLLAQQLVHSDP